MFPSPLSHSRRLERSSVLGSAAHSSSDSFPNTALNLPLNLNSTLTKDERIDHIKEQAFKSFKLKAEKWNRFVSTEENQRLLLDFLDEGQHPSLVLFTSPGGNLYAGDGQVGAKYIKCWHVQKWKDLWVWGAKDRSVTLGVIYYRTWWCCCFQMCKAQRGG